MARKIIVVAIMATIALALNICLVTMVIKTFSVDNYANDTEMGIQLVEEPLNGVNPNTGEYDIDWGWEPYYEDPRC